MTAAAPSPRARLALRLTLAALLAIGAAELAARNLKFGFDAQDQRCFEQSTFLITVGRIALERGSLYAFETVGVPYFRDGSMFVKRAVALPGDHVAITDEAVRINGSEVGRLAPPILARLGRPASTFARDVVVPDGHVMMMGDLPQSFDSRYWGFVPVEQLVGRAYALW